MPPHRGIALAVRVRIAAYWRDGVVGTLTTVKSHSRIKHIPAGIHICGKGIFGTEIARAMLYPTTMKIGIWSMPLSQISTLVAETMSSITNSVTVNTRMTSSEWSNTPLKILFARHLFLRVYSIHQQTACSEPRETRRRHLWPGASSDI